MNVYSKVTGELIDSPDFEKGYTEPGRKLVAHHDAVEEVSHYDVMPGTEHMNGGKGLRGKIIDVPAQPAYDEYEDCLYYVRYSDTNKPVIPIDVDNRLTALETGLSSARDELQAAKIMLGVE